MTTITTDHLARIGACYNSIARLKRLGGEISISREGADAYLAAYPEEWLDIVWLAQRLKPESDIIWKIARLAFREDGLAKWAACLGPENWREAQNDAHEALNTNAYYAAQNAANGFFTYVAIGTAGAIADTLIAGGADFEAAHAKARAEIIDLCLSAVQL